MPQFTTLTSRVIPFPVDNVDTDQIIPARFLKTTSKKGLGENLFADWRRDASGAERADFFTNQTQHRGSQILLAGDNFGCGSSREHAPWALTAWGILVVISTSFADIFRGNALKNGLLPVQVDPSCSAALFKLAEAQPGAEWTVDLEAQEVRLPGGGSFAFAVDPFARTCLLQGVDELGYLMTFSEQIAAHEDRLARQGA